MNPQPTPQQPGPANAPQAAPRARGYRGRPENQRNPNAPNLHVPRQQGQPRPKPQAAPAALPPPANKQTTQPVDKARNEPIKNSAFTEDFNTREDNPFLEFSPSMSTLMEVTTHMLLEYSVDDRRLDRSILPEYLNYYATALAWLRMISLKDLQRYQLTPQEQDLLRMTNTQVFTIPEPLMLYFKQYGTVVPPTETHLHPTFPQLPTGVINGFGGYYGPLGPDTHNNYEELPCLGVTAEAVRAAVGELPPGPYNSSLTTAELIVNNNLLGFKPLGFRHVEAKAKAMAFGITATAFPEAIPDTGFNLDLLIYISGYLAQSTTFHNTSTTIIALGVGGQTSQLVNIKPVTNQANDIPTTLRVEATPRTMFRESPLHTGLGLYTGAQLWKRILPEPVNNRTWACAATPQNAVPPDWIENANDRRNETPEEFLIDRFSATSYTPAQYIRQVVSRLVTARR